MNQIDSLNPSLAIMSILIMAIIAAKYLILNAGRPVRYDFQAFIWFSEFQITNSSFDYSRKKRKISNFLTLAILILALIELSYVIVLLLYLN